MTFCGNQAPETRVSENGEDIKITFTSDYSAQSIGFQINWEVIESEETDTEATPSGPPPVPEYSQIIKEGSSGYFTCDRQLPSDSPCYIRINVPKNHRIQLKNRITKRNFGCIKFWSQAGDGFLEDVNMQQVCNAMDNNLLIDIIESDTMTIDSNDFLGSFDWEYLALANIEGETVNATCGSPVFTPSIRMNHEYNPFTTVNFNDHFIPRVVGGSIARPHSYPWQVSLRSSNSQIHYCGGSILDSYHILTAAHCSTTIGKNTIVVGDHRNEIGQIEQEDNIYEIEAIYPHKNYNERNVRNDFMILKTTREIIFNDKIQPVCLPENDNEKFEDQDCIVTGWGLTNSVEDNGMGGLPQYLMQAKLRTLSNTECRNRWDSSDIYDENICAGGKGLASSCNGDSGGPLVCKKGNSDLETERYVLVGVVSWGQRGCGLNRLPSVFARVSSVLGWINEVTAEGFEGYDANRNNVPIFNPEPVPSVAPTISTLKSCAPGFTLTDQKDCTPVPDTFVLLPSNNRKKPDKIRLENGKCLGLIDGNAESAYGELRPYPCEHPNVLSSFIYSGKTNTIFGKPGIEHTQGRACLVKSVDDNNKTRLETVRCNINPKAGFRAEYSFNKKRGNFKEFNLDTKKWYVSASKDVTGDYLRLPHWDE